MLEAAVRSVDRAPPRSRATQPATEKLVQIESLRLHHFPATRSARAKWILYETVGDAFETVVVDLYRRAQYRPEFLLLNPNHNVPVLEICWASGETSHARKRRYGRVPRRRLPGQGPRAAREYAVAGSRSLSANASFRRILDGHDPLADPQSR